jgi:hypothetical protein
MRRQGVPLFAVVLASLFAFVVVAVRTFDVSLAGRRQTAGGLEARLT